MVHFFPDTFLEKKATKEEMLECIQFGDYKVNAIQIGNKWLVAVRHVGIALGVSSDTLKGIVRNHLPQQYQFSRKETGIDSSFDGSKLFTTIPGACRVMLGSTHPHGYDVLGFIIEIIYKIKSGRHRKQSIWRLV